MIRVSLPRNIEIRHHHRCLNDRINLRLFSAVFCPALNLLSFLAWSSLQLLRWLNLAFWQWSSVLRCVVSVLPSFLCLLARSCVWYSWHFGYDQVNICSKTAVLWCHRWPYLALTKVGFLLVNEKWRMSCVMKSWGEWRLFWLRKMWCEGMPAKRAG